MIGKSGVHPWVTLKTNAVFQLHKTIFIKYILAFAFPPIFQIVLLVGTSETFLYRQETVLDSGDVGLRPTLNGFGPMTPLGT